MHRAPHQTRCCQQHKALLIRYERARIETDWQDRLVDQALQEALGGETPPDLTDKILAAAASEPDVSLQPGENTMGEIQHVPISKRKHWAMFAVAASLFVAVGMLLFVRDEPRLAKSKVDLSNLDAGRVIADESGPAQEGSEIAKSEGARMRVDYAPGESEPAGELDDKVDLLQSTVADLKEIESAEPSLEEEGVAQTLLGVDGRQNVNATVRGNNISEGTQVAASPAPRGDLGGGGGVPTQSSSQSGATYGANRYLQWMYQGQGQLNVASSSDRGKHAELR